MTYYYDSDPNVWKMVCPSDGKAKGRLAAIKFGNEATTTAEQLWYEYCYNTAGRVTHYRLRIDTGIVPPGGSQPVAVNIDANYTWNNEGRLTGQTLPWAGYGFQFDSMGRASGMTERQRDRQRGLRCSQRTAEHDV